MNNIEEIRKELFDILMDYGDFFLTDYPNQAETKSIHPTIKRIIELITKSNEEAVREFAKWCDIDQEAIYNHPHFMEDYAEQYLTQKESEQADRIKLVQEQLERGKDEGN